METRANHVLIGAFTLAVVLAALLFALWAGKYQSQSAFREYKIVFEEAVTGLSTGGAVQYNGIKVGEVRRLSLDPADPGRVIALVRLSADTPVKTDTVAKLALTGLTGIAVIQLSGGSPEAPLLSAREDGGPPVIIAEASALQRLLSSSEDIATTASEVLVRIRRVLSEQNMERVGRVIADIEQVSGALASQHQDLGALVSDARAAAGSLRQTLAHAEGTLASIDRGVAALDAEILEHLPEISERLRRTLAALESLSVRTDAIVAENSEALASFSNQGLSQVGPAVIELRSLLRELARLAERLENDPASFLLGRDQPKEFEP